MEKDNKEVPKDIIELINRQAERTAKELLAIYYKETGEKDGEV